MLELVIRPVIPEDIMIPLGKKMAAGHARSITLTASIPRSLMLIIALNNHYDLYEDPWK